MVHMVRLIEDLVKGFHLIAEMEAFNTAAHLPSVNRTQLMPIWNEKAWKDQEKNWSSLSQVLWIKELWHFYLS